MARLTGTLVKRDTTSKETKTSSGLRICEAMKEENLVELRTWESEFPMRGARIINKCLESWYVGEEKKETIGRRGTPGFLTLGRP